MTGRSPETLTTGFSDIQWFMYHQRNVAFFAAFTARPLDGEDLLRAARTLVDLAPQLRLGFVGAAPDRPIANEVLRRVIALEPVASLDGFPERWLDAGEAVFSDPTLPLFRVRCATLPAARDGRAGFVLVQVAHALVEGADSARLSRSQSARHEASTSPVRPSGAARGLASAAGAVLAGLHLVAGNLMMLRPGPYGFATRAFPRAGFRELAQRFGVSQRAVFYALAMHTLFETEGSRKKRRISSTYSVLDEALGAGHDSFMRMQMRMATFPVVSDFPGFVRGVDAELARSESKPRRFATAVTMEGLHAHRGLSRLIPLAYTSRVFRLLPYDVVLGLIPPHRLGGGLTADLIEPVYAGAALDGANACVIVPNRRFVTFNFYVQRALLPRISRLDRLLGALISGSLRTR